MLRTNLIFSIDGLDEESYQNYRVGGTFKQADEGLRLIVKREKRLKQKSRLLNFNLF